MKRYNLSKIMTRAWQFVRKFAISMSEALRRSWASEKAKPINEARIAEARANAGISADVDIDTHYGWTQRGFMVQHGSKCIFQATLIHASKGIGKTYVASFFSFDQVQPIATAA